MNLEKQLFRTLQFSWMDVVGPSCNCSQIIHPGLTCLQQLLLKFKTVTKTVSKFYLVFHVIPYLMKLVKAIRQKKFIVFTLKSMISFVGSMIFMIHLVCGLKATICMSSKLNVNIEEFTLLCGGPLTGISILWQSKTRRQQIAYYALVRSIKSFYMFLLRRNILPFQLPKELFFIVFFGFLTYIYLQKRQNLKYSNMFQGLWGQI